MNKKITIIVFILVLVIAAYFLLKGDSDQAEESNLTNQEQKGFAEEMENIIASGESYRCSWQDEDNNSGEIYVEGKKYYMEVIDQERKSHMIVDKDNCMWSWGEENKQGMKICYDEPEIDDESQDVDLSEDEISWSSQEAINVDYNCEKTPIDESMFLPPSDVQFIDQSDFMFGQ